MNVLRNCGLDPAQWQGFAFGCGIERLAMLKYNIPDLRTMFAGDVRWAKHYGGDDYGREFYWKC
jgi:phenylalanyl-tRNA synthetase alpha chain